MHGTDNDTTNASTSRSCRRGHSLASVTDKIASIVLARGLKLGLDRRAVALSFALTDVVSGLGDLAVR